MRVHHLNCGCMCPLGGALMDGVSSGPTARLACHCLLIETDRDGSSSSTPGSACAT